MKKQFHHLPVSRKLILVLWIFVTVVIILLFFSYETIQTLSATRAYVAGEGLWSKAQKEALHYLVIYATSHSEQDYDRFEQAIQTPLGDKKARLELEKRNPDPRVVYDGFVQGRNRPEDVDGMATLFRRFRATKYMSEAVAIWAEGDGLIEDLQKLGNQLHAEVTSSNPDRAKVSEIAREVDLLGNKLTPLEDRFSYALGESARSAARLFLLVTVAATVLSIIMGAVVTYLMLRHIRRTDERYKHLIDTANDAILLINAETGVIIEANERSSQLFGLPVSQILGKPGDQFCAESHREDYWQMLRKTISGARITGKEMQMQNAEGQTVAVEVNTSLTELRRNRIIQGIFRDITARKRLEEEVRQSQKLEVVGRLAGGIAHDFNNLLMVILSRTSKIRGATQNQIVTHVEVIHSAALRAAALTKQLLAFGRKQVLRLEVVDLNGLLRGIQPLLSALPGNQIQLEISTWPQSLPVRVDPGKIEQVIMNLAVNGFDAMPKGGTFKIKVSRVECGNQHEQIAYALLEVSDTGCGMSVDTKAHIFEPFFTTKTNSTGSGLGLSTAYGIVKQSGGWINVQSAIGHGTTFEIYLPEVEQPVLRSSSRKPRRVRTRISRGSEVVLLAEDQSIIRLAVRECLEGAGYTVLEAGTGAEALEIAEQYSASIDVLVTDIIMPRLCGFELAKKVVQLHPSLVVVFISGYSEEALVESGMLSEPDVSLIEKPFDPETLVAKVQQLLETKKYTAA